MLGCRLEPDGAASERLRRRVALGIELYRAGAAPLIVLSGGGAGPVPEAQAMRDLALAAGLPAAALRLESDSRSTRENAAYTARLLHTAGKSRIMLVSDRLHLPRAALLFRRAGLDIAATTGVPETSGVKAVAAALYEIAGLLRSLLQGIRHGP